MSMSERDQEYDEDALGEEVTQEARVKRGAGIVVSVRLSAQEAEQLQILAQTTGKSLSEVAREALRASIGNAWRHMLPAGFSATATDDAPLTIFGIPSATTTAPMSMSWRTEQEPSAVATH
jgi:predicted DNA-binding protein